MRPIAMACLAVWTVSGPFCAGSEQELWSHRDLVADSTIEGRWRALGDTTRPWTTLIVRDSNAKFAKYLVTYIPDSGAPLHDDLYLTRIGGALFGDLYAIEDEHRWNAIPVHLLIRADRTNPRLVLRAINAKWLQKYAAAHPKQISTVTINDWVVFTDSTAKVRRFLLSTLKIDSAYDDSIVYVHVP